MSPRDLTLSLAAVALSAGVAYGLSESVSSRPGDLAALTPEADALLVLSPRALIRSRAWREIVTANDGDLSMRALSERCGMNPFAQLDSAVVSLPPQSEVLTVVASGNLEREALVACLETALGDTGTQATLREFEGQPALVSTGGSAVTFLTRSTVALSDEAGVRELIRRVRGEDTLAAPNEALMALKDSLPKGALNLVARIDPTRAQALERLTALAIFDRVEALSASLELGDPLQLRAVLSVPEESEAVMAILQAQLGAFKELTLVRMSGLGRVLEDVVMRDRGDGIELLLDISIEDAAELAQLLAR